MVRRICTIVSNPQIKETRLQELSNRLLKRNYPLQTYNYNTNNPDIFKSMGKGKHMLNGSEKMNPIMNRKWTKGQRQAPNLKQILTRAKFTTSEESAALP